VSDPMLVEVRSGMIGAWWEEAQRSMGPPPVVMGAVLGEDGSQVPFTEDQDAVGELGSGGQDESSAKQFARTFIPRNRAICPSGIAAERDNPR
jgi:hypothetical protein